MSAICWDIETAPLPDEELPFNEDAVRASLDPGEFNKDAVKLGNIKDQHKRAEKIEAERKKHDALRASVDVRVEVARLEFTEKATLDARTGRVLAIGYCETGGDPQPTPELQVADGTTGTEPEVLLRFWKRYDAARRYDANQCMVGFNIYDFDLPFIVRRCWRHGIQIPPSAFTVKGGRIFWSDTFIDLRAWWKLGVYADQRGTLNDLCAFFGLPEKGDGSRFWKLWDTDRPEAVKYQKNEMERLRDIAVLMGVVRDEAIADLL